jgi:hypothetical protein
MPENEIIGVGIGIPGFVAVIKGETTLYLERSRAISSAI